MYRIVFLFVSCTMLGCKQHKSALPYFNTADFTPSFLNENDAKDSINHIIADFSFTDQDGKQITQNDIEDKIHVANFIFTSCGSICPTMTKHMKLIQDSFLKDSNIVLLSYSVTPWIDSVPRLRSYASKNNILSPQWHLLTGNKNDIYTLARHSYYAEENLGFNKDSTDFLHTEHFLLIDPQKRIRGIYNGTLSLEIEQLIKDIRTLQQE